MADVAAGEVTEVVIVSDGSGEEHKDNTKPLIFLSQNTPKPMKPPPFRSHNHPAKPPSPMKSPNNCDSVAIPEGGNDNEGYDGGSRLVFW